jgi:hypothetical protein
MTGIESVNEMMAARTDMDVEANHPPYSKAQEGDKA